MEHWHGLDIVAGLESTFCGRKEDGTVSCWTSFNQTPRPIPGIHDAVQVAMGTRHACALRRSGKVACWGEGTSGQLGRPLVTRDVPDPVEVEGLSDVTKVAAGWNFSCALRKDGAVSCWGSNGRGEIGDPSLPETQNPPTLVKGVQGAVDIDSGLSHTCAILSDGSVTCWGRMGARATPPQRIAGIDDAKQLAIGFFSCALRRTGAPFCWQGINTPALEGVEQLAAGQSHACALLESGQVACWGSSFAAGSEGARRVETPVLIGGLPARPVPLEARVHPSIWGFRNGLAREFKGAKAALMAIDLKGTLKGDEVDLELLAADHVARVCFPRIVRIVLKKQLVVLPPGAEQLAGQVERLPPLETARDLERAHDLIATLDRDLEMAWANAMQTAKNDADLIPIVALLGPTRALERLSMGLSHKDYRGDFEFWSRAEKAIGGLIELEGESSSEIDEAIALLQRMVAEARASTR